MIIVVEGPSAAGKTNWCKRFFPGQTVWEAPISATVPDRNTDPLGAAEYWAEANLRRWNDALSIESETGLAICDSDPFKLHYVWSLWHTDNVSARSWETEVEINRSMFEKKSLGLADLFLISIPPKDQLVAQKTGDQTRTRRSFELHAKLSAPLRTWYENIALLDTARVEWKHPANGLSKSMLEFGRRSRRTGAELFDKLIEALPVPEST